MVYFKSFTNIERGRRINSAIAGIETYNRFLKNLDSSQKACTPRSISDIIHNHHYDPSFIVNCVQEVKLALVFFCCCIFKSIAGYY